MEKLPAKEHSSNFGLKEVVYCASIIIFSMVNDVRNAVAAMPNKNFFKENQFSEEKISLQMQDESKKIKDYIMSLVGKGDIIVEEYNLVRENLHIKKAKEYSDMDKKELEQELRHLLPEIDFNTSLENLSMQFNALIARNKLIFLNKVKAAYQVEYDFSGFSDNRMAVLAISIRDNRSNSILKEFDDILLERVDEGVDRKVCLLYLIDRETACEKLKKDASFFLSVHFAIKNYCKVLGID